MTLLAASQVHHLLWPSAYGPVLTTANLLRFAFAATVAVGAVLELRRVAAAHASLLAAEQDSRRRQADLAHLKDDFTSMVAHELATPVATIRGYARMLALGELGPAEHRRTVEAIEKETDLLQALVTDVETIATVERDDFVTYPFPVALDLILADAAAFARVLPGERAVTCPLDTGIRARADPERITQVLRNLLGNAAKYSPPGTPIEVRVARSAARVRVEVVDRGPGIPPDELARVFEKFGRGGDVRARGIAGHGLGLYLSRRIVRAHGGDLTVRSEAGAGSTFGFDLEVVA